MAADYITFDEFAAWTQIQGLSKTPMIEAVITAASRALDEYCQRHFWPDGTVPLPVTRTFAACDDYVVDLGPFNDLVSVTTLKTDEAGDGTFETTWATADYQLLPVSRPNGRPYTRVEAIAGRRFPTVRYGPGRVDRVQIEGVWGWAAVPAEVKQACKIKAARLFTRHQSPQGFQGFGDFAIRISRNEDPDVVDLLEPFRRYSVLVA